MRALYDDLVGLYEGHASSVCIILYEFVLESLWRVTNVSLVWRN